METREVKPYTAKEKLWVIEWLSQGDVEILSDETELVEIEPKGDFRQYVNGNRVITAKKKNA